MARSETGEILGILEEIRARLDDLAGRVAKLEGGDGAGVRAAVRPAALPAAPAEAGAPAAPPEAPPAEAISEEELLAISAAVAAYLGERVRVRQIRLLTSPAWAQQGRVSIQASHRLH